MKFKLMKFLYGSVGSVRNNRALAVNKVFIVQHQIMLHILNYTNKN